MDNDASDPTSENPTEAPLTADAAVTADMVEDTEVLHDADMVETEAPPDRPAASGPQPGVDVTVDDMEFVRRVFTQVKDVDFRTPPPPPPRGLTGPDKKLQDLRDKVRKLERDLARVSFVWTHKAEEVESVDRIVRSKEAERNTAVTRYRQFKERAVQALTSHKEEIAALQSLVESLTTSKSQLEANVADLQADVAREQHDKNALLADFRSKMEAAQTAFAQLRDQSARGMGNLEAQVAARDTTLDETRQELRRVQENLAQRDATLEERARQTTALQVDFEKRIVELETRNKGSLDQVASIQERLDGRNKSVAEMGEKLTEREKTTAQLAEQLTSLRTENEQRLGEIRAIVKLKEDENTRLQSELTRLHDDTRQANESSQKLQSEIDRLKEQLAKT